MVDIGGCCGNEAVWDAGSGSGGGGDDVARLNSGRRQPSWCDRELRSDTVVLGASEAIGIPAAVGEEARGADEAAICGAAGRRALPTTSTCVVVQSDTRTPHETNTAVHEFKK